MNLNWLLLDYEKQMLGQLGTFLFILIPCCTGYLNFKLE